jgi:hypothetical protein
LLTRQAEKTAYLSPINPQLDRQEREWVMEWWEKLAGGNLMWEERF